VWRDKRDCGRQVPESEFDCCRGIMQQGVERFLGVFSRFRQIHG
jgi:hypothetical protein